MEYTELNKNTINKIVKESGSVNEIIGRLYEHCYPDVWNSIEVLNGRVTVNTKTWNYICNSIIEKAEKLYPDEASKKQIAGLQWMNFGFSGRDDVPENKARLCEFTLKEGVKNEN